MASKKKERFVKSKVDATNRLLVATPTTGLVRMEWVQARYGQLIPTNWSMVTVNHFIHPYAPIGYLVADAQNLIVQQAIEKGFQWLLLIEHDNVLSEDFFIRINEYLKSEKVPVVSGLYFTKSYPTEPLIYRGRGTGAYEDFKVGDMVWADGVPNGCLLIHMSILRTMWDESPEYRVPNGEKARRVFDTPRKKWFDPETGAYNTTTGTSDLQWCTRIMEDKIFEKAGWDEYQKKEYPFLVDTRMQVGHIDNNGVMYPEHAFAKGQKDKWKWITRGQ